MPKQQITQDELDNHLLQACIAAHFGYAEVALAAGANVNTRDSLGNTPLHWAALRSELRPLSRLLLSNGANPSAKNNEGKTPLDLLSPSQHSLRVMLKIAVKEQRSHADRVTVERKDKGPPQVGG